MLLARALSLSTPSRLTAVCGSSACSVASPSSLLAALSTRRQFHHRIDALRPAGGGHEDRGRSGGDHSAPGEVAHLLFQVVRLDDRAARIDVDGQPPRALRRAFLIRDIVGGAQAIGNVGRVELVENQAAGETEGVGGSLERGPIGGFSAGPQFPQTIDYGPDTGGGGFVSERVDLLKHRGILAGGGPSREDLGAFIEPGHQVAPHSIEGVQGEAHLCAEGPWFLEVQVAPRIGSGLGDLVVDDGVGVRLDQVGLGIQRERLPDLALLGHTRINDRRDVFKKAIVPQSLQKQEPAVLRKLDFENHHIDDHRLPQPFPRVLHGGGDEERVVAAREDPLHGAARHVAVVEEEDVGH